LLLRPTTCARSGGFVRPTRGNAGDKEKDDLCMSSPLDPVAARALIVEGIGRLGFLRAATAVTAVTVGSPLLGAPPALAAPTSGPTQPLQPGSGPIHCDHYLPSNPDDVRWGYVPAIGATPSLHIASSETVTIDTVSHEGIPEDQGRDPVAYFGGHQVAENDVLTDAIAIARTTVAPRATSTSTVRK
jgi:hypothetical protein